MISKRYESLKLLFGVTLVGLGTSLLAQNFGGRIKDFVAPTVDQQGKRSVLKGADARHIGNRVYHIVKPVVTIRKPDDTVEMLIEAPECNYNDTTRVAHSTNSLSVKTGDEKLSISGKSWRWEPAISQLTIGEQVLALVQKSAVLTNSPTSKSSETSNGTNAPIRITSQSFQHDGEVARFMKQVRVVDEQGTVTCDLLQLLFEKKGNARTIEALDNVVIQQGETRAMGGRALYDISQNILTLTNKPSWQFGERSGSSDLLVIDRTNQLVEARGSVYMKMPRTTLAETNVLEAVEKSGKTATNDFVEIFADFFQFREPKTTNDPGIAFYKGNVRVAQPQGQLACRELTVYFSPKENKLFRAIAEHDVVVSRADGGVRGTHAVYELADEKITLTGNPEWKFGERSGTSTILTFYPETEELYALKNVSMSMPAGNRSAGMDFSRGKRKQNDSAESQSLENATNLVYVTAETFSHRGNVSVFAGNVLVKDRQGELSSELLTILAGASNQVHKITAEQNVIIRQPEMIAQGKMAVYNATNGIIELTGDPVITAPDKRVKADLFWINREKSTFSFRGNYKIEAAVKPTGTNQPMALFPLRPESKKKGAN